MKEFGAWLKNRRLELGIRTQEDIHAICGMSTSLYNEIERTGEIDGTSKTTRYVLASVMQVSLDELMARANGRPVPEKPQKPTVGISEIRDWILAMPPPARLGAIANVALIAAGRSTEASAIAASGKSKRQALDDELQRQADATGKPPDEIFEEILKKAEIEWLANASADHSSSKKRKRA